MTTTSQANDLKLVLEGKTSNVSIHENQNTITDLLNDTPGCFPNGLPTVTLNPPRLPAQAFARSHRNTTKLAQPRPPRGCEGFRGLLLAALGTDAQGDKVRYRSPVLLPALLPASVGMICDAASRARRPAAVNWFGELRGESADPPGICEGSLWRPARGTAGYRPSVQRSRPFPPGAGRGRVPFCTRRRPKARTRRAQSLPFALTLGPLRNPRYAPYRRGKAAGHSHAVSESPSSPSLSIRHSVGSP